MGKKWLKIITLLGLIVGVTGIAVAAADDQLMASWTGTQIKSENWDFPATDNGLQWYQIRYYPPGTFDASNYDNGLYFTLNQKFVGEAYYTSNYRYIEFFTPTQPGEWTIALFKYGMTQNPGYVPEFFKVNVPVTTPTTNPTTNPTINPTINPTTTPIITPVTTPVNDIPEFPTKIMPIVVAAGIMFLMSRWNKKK